MDWNSTTAAKLKREGNPRPTASSSDVKFEIGHVLFIDIVEIEQTRDLLERQLSDRPDDAFAMMQLSWANLALNREADALRLARQGTDLHPLEKDFLTGAAFLTALAQIEARAGQPGDAVTALRRLLAIPAGTIVSIAQLKIDPVWDPIRNDPGFQELLGGKELIGPNK